MYGVYSWLTVVGGTTYKRKETVHGLGKALYRGILRTERNVLFWGSRDQLRSPPECMEMVVS